jgi:signal transduction histidine kinase
MRERARAIGAEVDIAPAVPRGTAVRFRVPLRLEGAHE